MHRCLVSWLYLIFDILQNVSHYCPGFKSWTCIPVWTLVHYVCWIQAGKMQKVHLLAIITDLWAFFVTLWHKPLKFRIL